MSQFRRGPKTSTQSWIKLRWISERRCRGLACFSVRYRRQAGFSGINNSFRSGTGMVDIKIIRQVLGSSEWPRRSSNYPPCWAAGTGWCKGEWKAPSTTQRGGDDKEKNNFRETESQIRLSQRQNCLCACSPDTYLQIKIFTQNNLFLQLFLSSSMPMKNEKQYFYHWHVTLAEGASIRLRAGID